MEGKTKVKFKLICQDIRCPKTHEPFDAPEKCPICNVEWGTMGCTHRPWDKELKGMVLCPICNSDSVNSADALRFLNVKNIKKLNHDVRESDVLIKEIKQYDILRET